MLFPHLRNLTSDRKSMVVFDVRSASLLEVDYATAAVIEEALMQQSLFDISKRESSFMIDAGFDQLTIEAAYSKFAELITHNIIVDDNTGSRFAAADGQMKITAVLLNISQTCQLSCVYCFASQGSFNDDKLFQPLMDMETGRKAIDFFFEIADPTADSYTVTFFGGEPMLNWSLIQELTDYSESKAKAVSKKVVFAITSNGYMIDEEKVSFMAAHNIGCMISLDGDEQTHNTLRPHKSTTVNSYEMASNALKAIREVRDLATARATVTSLCPDPVKLEQDMLNAGASRVNLQFISCLRDDPLALSHAQLRSYTQAATMRVFEGNLGRLYTQDISLLRLRNRHMSTRFCSFAESTMAIDALGRIYACHRLVSDDNYLIGNIHSGLNVERVLAMKKMVNVDNRVGCRSCWARYMCGGGCIADYIIEVDNAPYTQSAQYCYYSRAVIQSLIELYIEEVCSRLPEIVSDVPASV